MRWIGATRSKVAGWRQYGGARYLVLTCWVLALLVVFFGLLRVLPKTPLAAYARYSSAVYAQDGTLLRLTTAVDEQYRLWTPLQAMDPAVPHAVLLYEDRWFYWHAGVNPAALVRSAWATYQGDRRQGGSTITMQLARKLYVIDSRTWAGKLRQIAAAAWLEARYSKRDILEAYLNFAPYGGNIEGVGAASLVYFHKRAIDLTLPEALTLAVIPQNPTARGGTMANSPALHLARSRVADSWLQSHPQDERLGVRHAVPMHGTSSLPFRAPHVANLLLRRASGEHFSSIDLRMQSTLERSIAQRLEQQRNNGIRNAVAMLLDTRTMQVKALVGSANFHDEEIDGQVNGVLAKRSPGSTLKPFIYALAFDQGVLHPMTMLKDAPTAFGPFSPENFDGHFVGPLSAQDALTRSRNVPAVQVASKLTRPSLYDLLKSSGVSPLASESHYGLALTLGAGEVSMEELARLYAMLANKGVLRAIRYEGNDRHDRTGRCSDGAAVCQDDNGDPNQRLVSEAAAFVTLDMLKTNPRPDTGQPAHPAVSWKTGTSWGFRDAWNAGVLGHYVLVVWLGNFDGAGNPAFTGIAAAAPLFFNMVDALRAQGLIATGAPREPPPQLARIEVCAATGDLPNADCPQRVSTWYLPGTSPIRISQLHQRMLIDKRTRLAVCEPGPHTQWQVVERWPTDMQRLFREASMPRRTPPAAPDCPGTTAASPQGEVQIVSPLRGVTYTLRLSNPVPVSLRAEGARGKQYWFANDSFVGESAAGVPLQWQPPKAGRYLLRVVDGGGASDSRELSLEVLP
jgi:penicillin-binding protein 1C